MKKVGAQIDDSKIAKEMLRNHAITAQNHYFEPKTVKSRDLWKVFKNYSRDLTVWNWNAGRLFMQYDLLLTN